jgi:uncharacterized protein YqgC (DUF456 family)
MEETLLLTCVIMAVGFLGCIIPVLPGPPIIWLGALFYAWRTNFTPVGPIMLAILLLLALVGSTADLWMSFLGAKKGGAALWSQLAALVGGIIGLLVLSVPGLLIGSIGAIVAVEWYRHRDWNAVMRASGGYLAGYLLAMVVEIVVAIIMIALFAGRLWLA